METLEIKRIGYYPVIGDDILNPLCADCFAENPTEDYEELGEDSTYTWDYDYDTPTHCCSCEALILTQLSKDGYWYIMEYLIDPRNWNKVTATWITAYGTELANYFVKLDRR